MMRPALDALRGLDRGVGQRSGRRRVLVDARTPVNYTMVAPICHAMAADARVSFFFTASEEPNRLRDIYHEALSASSGQALSTRAGQASDIRLIAPGRARLMRFDAYLASDFMWQTLPRGTCRIQTFHGVGGKYGFDAPTASLREWDRIFFVNERRLRNVVKAGAIDADSRAIRMVGLPKVDALVNGTWTRDAVLESLGLDPALPTILYAPTWSPASSLNAMGVDLIGRLMDAWSGSINLIVKLHDRSRDVRERYSGGVDWVSAIEPRLRGCTGAVARGHDISPYLAASDLMVTDHSSAGFEFLLRDRPIVRIHSPRLIAEANVHPDYVALLASVSTSAESLEDVVDAIEHALATPHALSDTRRAVAADLFYRPGGATARAVRHLYEAIELDPLAVPVAEGVACRP
jgi:CDP-Glycerol:Poly(glycerophosphate) glycerophosphotransferase